MSLNIQVHGLKNFSEAERNKFAKAMVLTKEVLNSDEFRERFLLLRLEQTNGYSNIQIYSMLMSGADAFNPETDRDIDVQLTMFYSFWNTVGYTYPTTWATWINRKFFSGFKEAEIGMNVVHEYKHNLGFGHKTPNDKKSVPYAAGYLVRDMINEKLGNRPTQYRPSNWSRFFNWVKRLF